MPRSASETLFIAIDPGKNGGVVYGASLEDLTMKKIPGNLSDLCFFARNLWHEACKYKDHQVWMEHNTGYMSGIGKDPDSSGVSSKSAFVFGRNTGYVEAAFAAVGLRPKLVSPVKWQSAAGVMVGSKALIGPAHWKKHLQTQARAKFPSIPPKCITLAVADALLIYYAAVTGRLESKSRKK